MKHIMITNQKLNQLFGMNVILSFIKGDLHNKVGVSA